MYGKSYDGVTGLIGIAQQPQGPRRGRRPGAGLRPLPLPVHQPGPLPELARHARALRRDRRHARARPATRSTTTSTRSTRPDCLALNWLDQQNGDHDSPYWRDRDLIAKTARQVDAAVPHPGLHREQHQARRHVGPLQRADRPEARVVRHVGPRARQRHRRQRPAADGPPGLVRRDDALLRPPREGRRQSPTTRPTSSRRATARGAPRTAGRPPTAVATSVASTAATTPTTATTTAPAPGSGTGIWTVSPRAAREDAHFAGVPKITRRRRPARPRTRTSSSTSTTSTPAATPR